MAIPVSLEDLLRCGKLETTNLSVTFLSTIIDLHKHQSNEPLLPWSFSKSFYARPARVKRNILYVLSCYSELYFTKFWYEKQPVLTSLSSLFSGSYVMYQSSMLTTQVPHLLHRSMEHSIVQCWELFHHWGAMHSLWQMPWSSSTQCLR